MNKYGSVERTFWARNIYQGALPAAIPADLTIASTDWHTQLFCNKYNYVDYFSVMSNIFIKQIGVFCNFADGLVFKSYKDVIDLEIRSFVAAPNTPAVTGTINCSPATRSVTGSGFKPGGISLVPGTIIFVSVFSQFFIVESVVDDANAVLTDYPKVTIMGGIPWASWGAAGPTLDIFPYEIRQFNQFLPCEKFVSPTLFTFATAASRTLIQVDFVNKFTGFDPHSVVFRTDTIDTAFNSADVSIDVGLVIEFTDI